MRAAPWKFGFCLLVSACSSGPQPPPFRPVADVKQLMQAVIDPAADELWESTSWVITANGTEERMPRSDAEWTAVRNHAIEITEAGNLLMMAPRAKDGGEWMVRSQALIDSGTAAWRAAEAKDVQKLFDTGGQIYEACSSCHEKYLEEVVTAK